MSSYQHCAADNCSRWAQVDSDFCHEHRCDAVEFRDKHRCNKRQGHDRTHYAETGLLRIAWGFDVDYQGVPAADEGAK